MIVPQTAAEGHPAGDANSAVRNWMSPTGLPVSPLNAFGVEPASPNPQPALPPR